MEYDEGCRAQERYPEDAPGFKAQGWGKIVNLTSMGGKLTFPGGEPDAVAKVIEKAISVTRPKSRYRVTPSAHFLMTQRAITPDRLWDTFMASQFPKPGAK